jgi:signal peptidase I
MSNPREDITSDTDSTQRKYSVGSKRWFGRVLIGRSWKRTLVRAAVLTVVAFIVFRFFLIPIRLRGMSMEPTYVDKSINFVNTLRYRFRSPSRGDVVAIKMAGRRIMLFKRVIGLPGEQIAFHRGVLLVNGQEVPEPYVTFSSNWDMPEVAVVENEFFVVGDNRKMPIEAHALGRVDKKRIVGGPLF